MNQCKILIFLCAISLLSTGTSHSAGMLMRIQQMKQQRQRPQMTPEQYKQYQEYQEQQQGDHSQGGGPATPSQPTYQQVVDQRNQAIAQAILNAHNQAVSSGNVQGGTAQQPNSTVMAQQMPATSPAAGSASGANDVVDLSEVWKKLDNKSRIWTALVDDQSKMLTVSEFMDRYRAQGVKINAPPQHYVQMIDQITGTNPSMLDMPFGQLLQIVAIVDYDFDNGMDKDVLARKVLGDAGYEANKKRLNDLQQQQHQ